MDERTSILAKVDVFSRLAASELEEIARYSEVRCCRDGESIFQEQDESRELFVLVSGKVLVTRIAPEGKELDLARYIPGDFFGEMEMFEGIRRQATARSEGESRLLVFPSGGMQFRDFLERHPVSGANILHRLLSLVAGRIRNSNRLISERTPWVEDLKRQLLVDKLTGLYNRTYLSDELPGIMKKSAGDLCLAVIKPDTFKQINDVYGHGAGDGALKLIAETVRSVLAGGIHAVRYRGDEYLLILQGFSLSRAEELAGTLKILLERLDFSEFTGGVPLSLTFSFGIADTPDASAGAEPFIAAAFERMLEARNAGGSRICSRVPSAGIAGEAVP